MRNRTLTFKEGTQTDHDAYTGIEGELTYNISSNSFQLHDGVTAGGNKLLSGSLKSERLDGLTNSSSGFVQADGDGTFSVAAGSGLQNIVEDTSPQLGGVLDTNGNNIEFGDSTGAEVERLKFGAGDDISMYWDGTDGHLEVLGTLNIEGSGETLAKFVDDGAVTLYYDNSVKLTTATSGITVTGDILPEANGTRDLGSTSLRWQNIYTSDLNLNNGIGDYTVVEGEEDLFLYNNKSGKVFKFALIEVDPSEATPKIEDLKDGSTGGQ